MKKIKKNWGKGVLTLMFLTTVNFSYAGLYKIKDDPKQGMQVVGEDNKRLQPVARIVHGAEIKVPPLQTGSTRIWVSEKVSYGQVDNYYDFNIADEVVLLQNNAVIMRKNAQSNEWKITDPQIKVKVKPGQNASQIDNNDGGYRVGVATGIALGAVATGIALWLIFLLL